MPNAQRTVGEGSIGFLSSLFSHGILRDVVDTLDNCAVKIWKNGVCKCIVSITHSNLLVYQTACASVTCLR